MEQKTMYHKVNYIVSILGLALMAYLAYMMLVSPWGFIFKIILLILFDGIVSLQVLLLALSIGKRDRNPHINYQPLISFNIFMLVLYGIGFVAYHIYVILVIFNVVNSVFA